MPQWEYSKIDLSNLPPRIDDVDLLDDAGREGWELVGIAANNFAYLKRLSATTRWNRLPSNERAARRQPDVQPMIDRACSTRGRTCGLRAPEELAPHGLRVLAQRRQRAEARVILAHPSRRRSGKGDAARRAS